MPLHPSARAFLDATAAFPQPYDVPLEQFRNAAAALAASGAPLAIGSVEDRLIAGGDAQNMAIRIYKPERVERCPIVVWAHGGSFVRGSLAMFDAARRAFAKATNMIVVAVDQRLSPEAHFPKPLEDVCAAAAWASMHAADLGGDPDCLGVAGESSGGNLAAAATLLARARGTPRFAFQILFSPLLDACCRSASIDEYAEGYLLTKKQLLWCYDQYAPGVRRDAPLLSPLSAPDVAGLPPAVIVTVECDPVRDEGECYAKRLADAGVHVRTARIEGMVHHFPGFDAAEKLVRLSGELVRHLRERSQT